MPAAAIATLVLTALLVLALAYYLTRVVIILRKLIHTLSRVTFGVRAIAHRTAPLEDVLTDINANLATVAEAVEEFVERVAGETPPPAAAQARAQARTPML